VYDLTNRQDAEDTEEDKRLDAMQKKVKVKPNSKRQSVEEEFDGSLTVRLRSLPVDGKANEELVKLLAERFDVPKSEVRIKSGLSSRQKLIEINTDG